MAITLWESKKAKTRAKTIHKGSNCCTYKKTLLSFSCVMMMCVFTQLNNSYYVFCRCIF